MIIPHQTINVDIYRVHPLTVDLIGHVNDKDTRYIDLQLIAKDEPIELESGCKAYVTYVSDGFLIDQDVECEIDQNSKIIIGFDSETINEARSGILLIQPKVVDSNDKELTLQVPIAVRVSPDLAQISRISDDSHGSYAEVVQEIAAARGEYDNLKERLDNSAAPSDEQVAEAVEDYLDEHPVDDTIIISGYDSLTPDVTFDIENDDVEGYLSDDEYTFADDKAYSGSDYASSNIPSSIESNVTELPNSGSITIPASGAQIILLDTVSNKKWSENVSEGTYEVKNLIPNRLYTYIIKNSSGEIIKSGSCKASGQVRFIDAGKAVTYPVSDPTTTYERPLFNIRDLGGWQCDGGALKYGLLYRGCRLNGNYTNNQSERYGISLTPEQVDFFKIFLGIKDEIDFRQLKNDPDSDNTETAGDDSIYETSDDIKDTALGIGVDYAIFPLKPYVYGLSLSNNAVQNRRYAEVIKRIAKDITEGKPCYIHCLEGADRTGTVSMLLLALCGVSRNDIERDYELTSFSKDYAGNRNRRARNDTAQSYHWMTLMQYLLNNMTGNTFRDKIIDYVLKIGVTIDEINAIRAGLIDGTPEKIKNPNSDVSITYNLTNINIDNTVSSLAMYQPFEATLTALNMTDIESVTVTMGGTDITSSCYANEKINIPKVTGDIVITATAASVSIPDISGKVNVAQGVANAGKFLVVGNDGNVTLKTLEVWQGGNY